MFKPATVARLFFILSLFCFLAACRSNGHDKSSASTGTTLEGLKVPEGYSIERIVDSSLISFPMFGSFDSSGRLFVFESDGSTPSTEEMLKQPRYHIRLLEDKNSDGIFESSKIFADSLSYPKGGVFYRGSLYVTSSPDFLKLTDVDNDGIADKRERIHTGWVLNHNAATLGGPFLGPDGYMYMTDARRSFDITTKEGKREKGKGARIWRCLPDGTGLEPIVGGGYDNAIELIFMPAGETIGTMTYFVDPQGGQRDALMHWVEGGVYPKPNVVIAEDQLKLTGELMPVMTKLARVAPSGLMRYEGDVFGKEFTGNLFSAEFNTGRIIRSIVSPDGATFKTEDSAFVTSTTEDLHPTDVFQDADGSIIVINTGGWFIAGCPLSRVAKLNVPGGIYRIRKNNTSAPQDPWGKQIDLEKTSPEMLCSFLGDRRHVVRNNAKEKLVALGDIALPAIQDKLLTSDNSEIRASAAFILGRIGTDRAREQLRKVLTDSSAMVRTAAARMAGLLKDKASAEQLKALVVQENLQVRRQSAIALEQIGDPSATDALLQAAAGKNDRYAEHAVIHSLFSLKNSQPLVAALNHSSPGVRKAALIALDQMDGNKLQRQQVVPFLQSENSELVQTGIWVTLHHPTWADVVVDHVKRKSGAALTENDRVQLENLLTSFSSNRDVQQFVATELAEPSTSTESKNILLNVMATASLPQIPATWIAELQRLLKGNNYQLRSKALSVIQTRKVKALGGSLQTIIANETTPPEFRLKALAAKLSFSPSLSDAEFKLLVAFLDAKNEILIRQHASRLLQDANLAPAQLVALTATLKTADVYLLPSLISAYEGNGDEQVGKAFVSSLTKSPSRLENISEQDFINVISKYPTSVKQSAEPLINAIKEKNAERLSRLQETDSLLTGGDIAAGRKLFFGKATCSACHSIVNEGGVFAPDLTNIGEIRSRHDILEAIMYPSASFAREYETNIVVTKTNTYNGIIKENLADAILLETGPGATVRVPRSEITSITPGNVSLMPPLEKQLTQKELADVLSYLTSLPDGAGGTVGL